MAPMFTAIRGDLPQVRHFVVLEDGSDEPFDGGIDYEDALAAASPERGFEPRSADDLYFLYTGGTTGMPKGVMWRAEDIFFAALGGGGFGQPPIEKPEELAERVTADDARTISYVNAPMMHGGGQWASFINFYGGGTVVLNTMHHFDPDAVWRAVEREQCNSIMVVGDAMAPAVGRGAGRAGRRPRHVVGDHRRLGRRHPLPRGEGAAARRACRTHWSWTASARRRPAPAARCTTRRDRRRDRASRWARSRPCSATTSARSNRARASRAGWRAVGTSRSATTRTRRRRRRRSSSTRTGKRWVVPGDSARIEDDGTITLLGRGSVCINTGGEKVYPEEVEAALKTHPDVFDAVVVGVPDDRFGERVAAIVQPRPSASPALAAAAGALPHPARRLQGAAPARGARPDRAHPGRQARLPVGEADRDRTRGELNGRRTGVLDDRARRSPTSSPSSTRTSAAVIAGELLGRRNQVVHGLRALGLQRGDVRRHGAAELRRGVRASTSRRMQAGWYLTPINHHLVGPEIAYIVQDCEAKAFVGHERFADVCTAAAKEIDFPADRTLRRRRRRRVPALRASSTAGQPDDDARRPHDRRGHALHVGHHGQAQGRAPVAARRRRPRTAPSASRGCCSCSACSRTTTTCTSAARRCTTPPCSCSRAASMHARPPRRAHGQVDAGRDAAAHRASTRSRTATWCRRSSTACSPSPRRCGAGTTCRRCATWCTRRRRARPRSSGG